MNDFLTRLIERNAGTVPVIQPLIRPAFTLRTRLGNRHLPEPNDIKGETGEDQAAVLDPARPESGNTAGINELIRTQSETATESASVSGPTGYRLLDPVSPGKKNVAYPGLSISARPKIGISGQASEQAETIHPMHPAPEICGDGGSVSRPPRRGQRLLVSGQEPQRSVVSELVDESIPPAQGSAKKTMPGSRSDKAGKDCGIPIRTVGKVLENEQIFIDKSLFLEDIPRKRLIVRPLQTAVNEPNEELSPDGVLGREWAAPGSAKERHAFIEPSPPAIEVTIGRVEVQAILPPNPSPPPTVYRRKEPLLSLDAYLKRRNEARQ